MQDKIAADSQKVEWYQGWWKEKMKSSCLMGGEFQFYKVKKFCTSIAQQYEYTLQNCKIN